MKKLQPFLAGVLLLALAINAAAVAREYSFSGSSVTGRFAVEEYTSLTPVSLQTNFSGSPYRFLATMEGVDYSSDNFQLTVFNNFVGFGRSDWYWLQGNNMELRFIGTTLGLPYTSTLPHALEAYHGRGYLRLLNPDTGVWTEVQITSLQPVPEPSTMALLLLASMGALCFRQRRVRTKPNRAVEQ